MAVGPCALCLQARPVICSHFLSAGLYRLLRDPSQKNEHPVVISRDATLQTSSQMKFPLLCSDCEQCFNRNGEGYVIGRLRSKHGFPLLDRLNVALPVYESPRLAAFSGDAVGLETDKMAYFALSILWRASVRKWDTVRGQNTSVVLDEPFKEDLRMYLLRETGFPKDVVVIATVATDFGSQESCFVPNRIRENPMIAYGLMTKGLYFRILFGSDLPDGIRDMCCASGKWKLLFKRDCQDNLFEAYGKLMETSVMIGRLVAGSTKAVGNAA
jgi:hypothetical protein